MKLLHIRTTEKLHKKLRIEAAKKGLSITSFVNQALRLFLSLKRKK